MLLQSRFELLFLCHYNYFRCFIILSVTRSLTSQGFMIQILKVSIIIAMQCSDDVYNLLDGSDKEDFMV